jgi:hypothetical protein
VDVKRFAIDALKAHRAVVKANGVIDVDLQDAHRSFVESTNIAATLHDKRHFRARFEEPVDEKTLLLARTHPIVEGLASWIIDTALDPITESAARRCGAVRTTAVTARTTALVIRIRYDLTSAAGGGQQIAEEARIVAFCGAASSPEWLDDEAVEVLLAAIPSGIVFPEVLRHSVSQALADLPALRPALEAMAIHRALDLRESHERVRTAGRMVGKTRVEARLPVDLLGVYVYLPGAAT